MPPRKTVLTETAKERPQQYTCLEEIIIYGSPQQGAIFPFGKVLFLFVPVVSLGKANFFFCAECLFHLGYLHLGF